MALYVYRCPFCVRKFEKFRDVEDRRRMQQCPHCDNEVTCDPIIQPSYFMFAGGMPSYEKENDEALELGYDSDSMYGDEEVY